jgi:hypothetical protein
MTDVLLHPIFPDPAASETDRNYARRWWTLAVLCLSLVVIGVDNTIPIAAPPPWSPTWAPPPASSSGSSTATRCLRRPLLTAGTSATGSDAEALRRLVVFGLGSVASASPALLSS